MFDFQGNSQKTTNDLVAYKKPGSSSRNAAQPLQPSISSSTSSGAQPAQKEAQFDPKFFLKQGSIIPKGTTLETKSSDDHVRSLSACDTSRLPPEIASFMTRVRPNAQPVDTHLPNSDRSKFNAQRELLVEAVDEVRRPHSAETPGTRSPRVSVSPMYDSPRVNRIEVSEAIVRHQPSPDVERVTVPDTASVKGQSSEASELQKQVKTESTRTVSPPVTLPSVAERNVGSNYATYDTPRSVINEMERQAANSVANGRTLSAQPKKAASFSETSSTASKYSYQRYRQEASQKKQHQQTSGFPNKSLSLPRVQQPPTNEISQFGSRRGDVGPRSPNQSSAPSTPITHSDLVAPTYTYPQPQGVGMGRSGSLDNTSNALHLSQFPPTNSGIPPPAQTRAYIHQANPRSQNYKPQRQQYYAQDVRRTQTFTSGQVSSRPAQASQFHERSPTSPVHNADGEDSLPNSPTYFSQYPPNQDRGTPSPNTQATNQSFQEHLNSLEGQLKQGRKMRILDWMQRTEKYDPRYPMFRDPGTHVPSQPYQKQPHVYATANDLDIAKEQQVRDQSSSHASQQTGHRHDYGGSGRRHTGMMQQQGYVARQQPQQQQQPSRERLHTFPYVNPQAHRQPQRAQGDRGYNYYPPTTRTGPPRGEASTQTATASGSSGVKSQGSYPTAKFGKDFYVIDV